jgi:hypothetical protein
MQFKPSPRGRGRRKTNPVSRVSKTPMACISVTADGTARPGREKPIKHALTCGLCEFPMHAAVPAAYRDALTT